MKIASTDTLETESQSGEEKAKEQKRTFLLALAQGTFIRISFAFADSTTILSAFIYRLTTSNTLVGLTGSIGMAGWMWPQLLISNLLEHRPRKMPFYALGMSLRTFAWVAIFLSALLIGPRNYGCLPPVFSVFILSVLHPWVFRRFRTWILFRRRLDRIGVHDFSACVTSRGGSVASSSVFSSYMS